MFGMSFTEIVIILAIALVVLGPDRLPTLARGLGKAMREFRRATREIQTSLEVEEVRRTIRERAQEVRDAVNIEPVIDPSTGKPIRDESDDLAEQKAYLGTSGVQGPAIIRKPRRPIVATGTTVAAGGAAGVEAARGETARGEAAEPSLEAVAAGVQAHEQAEGGGGGAAEGPVERTSTKREES
jgi:TatA/E family protein of Tat protein translocase